MRSELERRWRVGRGRPDRYHTNAGRLFARCGNATNSSSKRLDDQGGDADRSIVRSTFSSSKPVSRSIMTKRPSLTFATPSPAETSDLCICSRRLAHIRAVARLVSGSVGLVGCVNGLTVLRLRRMEGACPSPSGKNADTPDSGRLDRGLQPVRLCLQRSGLQQPLQDLRSLRLFGDCGSRLRWLAGVLDSGR